MAPDQFSSLYLNRGKLKWVQSNPCDRKQVECVGKSNIKLQKLSFFKTENSLQQSATHIPFQTLRISKKALKSGELKAQICHCHKLAANLDSRTASSMCPLVHWIRQTKAKRTEQIKATAWDRSPGRNQVRCPWEIIATRLSTSYGPP